MTAIVEFNQSNYRIVEDGTALGLEVTLVRTGDTTGPSDVSVQLIYGSTDWTDFTDNSAIPISFAANETSKTVTIPISDDPDPESIENLVLLLSNPSLGSEIGSQGAATLEIIDNDNFPIVEFDAASYSVNENDGSITVALTRLGNTSSSSDVEVFWNDGSANNSSDFNLPPSTFVNFAATQTSATVNVPINDDGDTEGIETFFANLGGFPSGATIGSQAQTSIEIVDNDGPAIVELSSGSYSVSENAGMATVALTRTGDTSNSSSVEIALYGGTATSGVDFSSPASSLVNFTANQTSATVDIPITNDVNLEGQENLLLGLINPSGGSYIGLQSNATLDIIDDDGQPIVELDSSSYSVNEADGVAVATINRSGEIGSSSSVEILLTDGSATNWVDFSTPPSTTVNFAANQSSAKVFIPIAYDGLVEDTEDFTLSLVNPSNGIIGVRDAATVEIVDNDGLPTIEFESASYSGNEQDGVILVTVKRSGNTNSSFSVGVQLVDGTASVSDDTNWSNNNTTINFAENQSSVTFGVPIRDDGDTELTENLTLALANPSGANLGAQSTANLDILDNEGWPLVEFGAASYLVAENGGTAIIQVKRTGDSSASSSVEVVLADRSATNGTDYSNPASNIVNFAPSQTSATVLIPIVEDIDIEGTEDLALQLANPSWGTDIGQQGAATLEIVDNDGPAIVEFDSASYSGSEDSELATVLVTRSGDTSNPSTVGLLLSDGTARATSDVNFPLPTATINFAANQTSATVDIPVIDDSDLEETENLFLSLVDPSSGSYIGSQSNATLDITDNDSSEFFEIDSSSYSVAEGDGHAILNVSRTGNIGWSSTVYWYLNDGSAKNYGDFNSQNGSINFAPYQTSGSIAIPIIDDNQIEPAESFFAELELYGGGVSYRSNPTIIEIVDNDGYETVEFASSSYSVSEGDGVATIELKRSGDIHFSPSTVDLFLYDRTALANADVNFTPPSIPVNFAANQTSTTVTIPVTDDAEIEGTESLLLSLGTQSPSGTYIGNQSTATLDILDNDGGSVVELESASYSVNEGDGVAVVTLSRSGNISSESTVNLLLTDGSATNSQDFSQPWSNSISFGANQTSATVLIPITDDADIENTENFLLSLDNPSTGTIGSQNTATVEIADNDFPPVVEFETASYSVNEHDGKALVTLKRTGDTSATTDVEVWPIDGTADSFYDLNLLTVPINVSFTAGRDSVSFPIEISDDYDIEGTEHLAFGLTIPLGGSIGAQNVASLEIIDNDGPALVEFDAASYSASENGAATIQLKRSGDISSESSVDLLLSDGSAWKYSDFNDPINSRVYFAPGQTSAKVVVPIIDDGDIEGIEDLTLELEYPNGANIGTRGTATLEIVDNDGPSVVELAAASYSVAENGGFASIYLTREGDTNNPSTVELLLSNGSATNGSDFNNPASNIVEFAANQTSATVYVPITDDLDVEGTEDLTVELANPSPGSNIGSQGTATLEIVDNEGPSEIQFAAASYSVNENGGFARINVMRSGDASSSSSVEIVASAGSATSNVDFLPPTPYIIDFAANQTNASVVIPIINDADSEGLEDLSLELVNPSGSSLGSQNTATLEIVDDENSPPAIALPGTGLDYIENSAAAAIDSSATVADANSSDFDGGTLTVSFSSGGTADDRLSIQDLQTASSKIGLSGSNVTYEGTTIGSFSGGFGLADLVVTFNANSTPAAAQELVRNIAYENLSENPIGDRIVEFILTDGDGATSSAVTQTVRVQGTNDAPAISPVNISGDEDTEINLTAADFTGSFSDIDADSLAKVKVTSLSAEGNLKLNGTAVTLNQEINAADLGNLTFTPAANFNGSTSFNWNGSDGSDYSPAAAAVNLTVNPVNDAPTVSTVSLSGAEDTDITFTAADFSNGFGDPDGDSYKRY